MIHPEKQRGTSEVLKELVYPNLLLYLARGSHKQRCKILRAWKALFDCIQNYVLDSNMLHQTFSSNAKAKNFKKLALFCDSTSI